LRQNSIAEIGLPGETQTMTAYAYDSADRRPAGPPVSSAPAAAGDDAASVLTEDLRAAIQACFPRYPTRRAVVLPALHLVQEQLGCVPLPAVEELAQILGLAPAEVHDTMSFYGFFRTADQPLGRHRCWVCRSIACAVRDGENLLDYLCQRLGIRPGQTTPDGRVTVEFAECLGGCDFAPCMLVDGELHKDLTREKIDQLVAGWQAIV
jgi:NADH-quinone oxidoreductase subunit E